MSLWLCVRHRPRECRRASLRRLQNVLCRFKRLVEECFEEAGAGGVGGGEGRLQPVAEGHEGVDLGHNAVLFGEGWEGD